jgi:hypothetical protein
MYPRSHRNECRFRFEQEALSARFRQRSKITGFPSETRVSWYRKAADQDYAYAQFLLGYVYDKGSGVPRKGYEPGETLAMHQFAVWRVSNGSSSPVIGRRADGRSTLVSCRAVGP